MFIQKNPPNMFSTGDILSPESINENNNYLIKAVQFEANKQTARWTTTYQLVPSASIILSTASSLGLRTRHIPTNAARATNTTPIVTVESVSVLAYYTSTSEFRLVINGGKEEIIFPARDSSLALEPYTVVRLMNSTNTNEILMQLVGLSSTSLPSSILITKFDVTVGFSSDKYLSGNQTTTLVKPNLSLISFNDINTADANVFAAIKTSVETAATAAKAGLPFRWTAAEFWSLTASSADFLTAKPLPTYADPSYTGVTSAPNVIGLYIEAKITAGSIGDKIYFEWCDGSLSSIINYNSTSTLLSAGAQTVLDSLLVPTVNQVRYTAADATANDRSLRIYCDGTINIEHATIYMLLQ